MDRSLDPLGRALEGRYRIERELGHGGNAVVYLARDLKHDRQVALKVLQPELALAVRAERFLREIQIAAKLTHPHILSLYDSGQVEQYLYYVMPYVPGESLRDRLTREKQLPVEDALKITREVAAALDYAHRQGVVHRDIKPENILLSEGEAVVADFGIARALTVATGQTVTETGVAVGTPAYMSPEQAGAAGEIDGRSDIYSLGCVLYEMLAGHPPFHGTTAQEVLSRHALDPVPTVRAARTAVPEGVERTVKRTLAKQPADRFATAAEFVAALTTAPSARVSTSSQRTLVFGTGLAVLLGVGLWARSALVRPPRPAAASIAVLRFVNLSTDPENEYFSDGMSEELINALARVPGLRVPAATSTFALSHRNLGVRQIAESLRVATVLEGSVRRAGNRVRISAQLINAGDGYHLWSDTYDREIGSVRDVLAVQNEIARAIVGALRIRLQGGDTAALVRRSTDDSAAYDLYLRGRYLWARRSGPPTLKAIEYLERAVERDPSYALAYSGLADAYLVAGNGLFMDPDVAFPRAKAAALKALALDSNLAEPYASLGRLLTNHEWDLAGAERAFQRAIALNPAYATAHSWYGNWLLGLVGRFDEAVREAKIGLELSPLEPYMHNNLGWVLYWARRTDESMEEMRRARDLVPDWGSPPRYLARAYIAKGMWGEAAAEFEVARRLNPGGVILGEVGYLYAMTGKRRAALEILGQLRARPNAELMRSLPALYLALGEKDSALAVLERAFARRPATLREIKVDPHLDRLREEPRFKDLLRKMGLDR